MSDFYEIRDRIEREAWKSIPATAGHDRVVAFELRKSGVRSSSLKKIVNFLRRSEQMDQPLSQARLIVRGHDVAVAREGELVSVLSRPGQGYLSFVVDLSQILGQLVDSADTTKTFAHALASASAPVGVKKQSRAVTGSVKQKRTRS